MLFVLLGRDVAAPAAVRAWIKERVRLEKNRPGDSQIQEAEQWILDWHKDARVRLGEESIKLTQSPLAQVVREGPGDIRLPERCVNEESRVPPVPVDWAYPQEDLELKEIGSAIRAHWKYLAEQKKAEIMEILDKHGRTVETLRRHGR